MSATKLTTLNLAFSAPTIVYDTETDGLSVARNNKAFGAGFAARVDGEVENFWLRESHPLFPAMVNRVKKFNGAISGHNLKFDLHAGRHIGLDFSHVLEDPSRLHDTIMLSRILATERPASLDNLIKVVLGRESHKGGPKDWIRSNSRWFKKEHDRKPHFGDVPRGLMKRYNLSDTETELLLLETFLNELKDEGDIRAYDLDRAMIPIAYRAECHGMRFLADRAIGYCNEMYEEYNEIRENAGGINFGSWKQVLDLLLSRGVTEESLTDLDGKITTNARQLNHAASVLGNSPQAKLIKSILRYRHLDKTIGTFLDPLITIAKDNNGIIQGDIRLGEARTGRFSMADPNLQQVPKRKSLLVRECFGVRPGFILVCIDYSQIEFRIMSGLSGSERLIQAYLEGSDFHTSVQEMLAGIGVSVDRHRAKIMNYAIMYGAGVKRLAGELGISLEEAIILKGQYNEMFPEIKSLTNTLKAIAEEDGFIRDLYGRRYHLTQTYKALSWTCQGMAGTVLKYAMRKVDKILRGQDSKFLIPVHDELVFGIAPHEIELVPAIIDAMEDIPWLEPLRIPMVAELSWSLDSWGKKTEEKGVSFKKTELYRTAKKMRRKVA